MRQEAYHLIAIIIIFVFAGLFSIHFQHKELGIPLTPTEKSRIWTLDTKVEFESLPNVPVKLELYLPILEQPFTHLNESFISRSFGVTLSEDDDNDNRKSVWSKRRASGKQTLYHRLIISENHDILDTITPPTTFYTDAIPLTESENAAAESMLDATRNQSADIRTFIAEILKTINDGTNNNAIALLNGNFSSSNKAAVAQKLLSQAHIPSTIVQGILLSDLSKDAQIQYWLRSHNGREWLYFNPESGKEGLPSNALIIKQGGEPILEISGGKKAKVVYGIKSQEADALALAAQVGEYIDSPFSRFSLMQLPIQAQQVYQILLMVPIGVLIILALRTYIGIQTFGTFTPVLIALAFRETEVVFGIILFTFVSIIGLAVRSYLEYLKLLLLPRLGIIMTVVIVVMAAISLVTFKLGIEKGLSVALFPMVILTMTIERMSILWEERGAQEALICGIGSLLAAVLAYYGMENMYLQHILFTFPGALLLVMALMILIGRYRGYRLSELFRFNALTKN